MFCTRCGVQLEDQDRFCHQCGERTVAAGPAAPPRRQLARDVANGKIAGVCAGFAKYFEVDIVLMRFIWLAAALLTGIGILAYPIAWIVMPKEPVAGAAAEFARQNG